MEVLQVPDELERMLALYEERRPKRVLEIGVWQGGTLREWLRRAVDGATIVAIDLKHPNRAAYDRWIDEDVTLIPLYGESQERHVLDKATVWAPYDWIFIDADHALDAVYRDAQNSMKMLAENGVMLFHDIVGPTDHLAWYPPGEVFASLTKQHRHDQFVSEAPSSVPHGIGVIYAPKLQSE